MFVNLWELDLPDSEARSGFSFVLTFMARLQGLGPSCASLDTAVALQTTLGFIHDKKQTQGAGFIPGRCTCSSTCHVLITWRERTVHNYLAVSIASIRLSAPTRVLQQSPGSLNDSGVALAIGRSHRALGQL
jgi:hypothetical protein